ncbi:peptidase M23-like protein [Nonlabens dokdonensis]|uniref:Peptidase M23-like protein n=1 Tax=Nonlabens dokdonensis TaxID=328515 RepID=A0ABX5PYA7_9FLAO|nr:M23 family metallopeptidase [Nonlabens dokdonensis]PZX40804.1 peptidase M23-like protein [Nonlabens dokdonensis]
MIRHLFCFLAFFLLISRFGESQTIKNLPQDYFVNPLDIDLKLSGTFGELRSNHFHSGLDIKTNQRTGAKVYASASGYVSRIKIERYGYGKALYITHPNGYTTVYAHLKKFSPRIEAYLKKKQYAKESYSIQLYPTDLELRVDQGEVVAYSGNSGGSGGPHLHFEIRDSAARPLNPMMMGIEIPDTKRPLVKQIKAFPLSKTSTINGKHEAQLLRLIPLKGGKFKVEEFSAYGDIGIGVNTSDQQNGANNQNGTFHIASFFNGTKNFEMTFDRYAFSESRHINQLIDYEHFKKTKSRISRLYIPNNSPLSLYEDHVNNGVLQIVDPGTTHLYRIEIADYKENKVQINMSIKNDAAPDSIVLNQGDQLTFVDHNMTYRNSSGPYTLMIPKGALYESVFLDLQQSSDTIKVHSDIVPLHKNMIITYDASAKKDDNLKQYYIGRVTDWGAVYHVNTRRKGNILSASTRTLGTYAISKDDVDPTIKPINFKNKQWISKNKTLKLKIADADTGVDAYRATVNGKFILMEYDYKTGILTHDFDDGVVTDTENELKVIVTDNVGNSTTFEATFFRKS